MAATDAAIQALLAQNQQLINSATQLSTDNAVLRSDFAIQRAEAEAESALLAKKGRSTSRPPC